MKRIGWPHDPQRSNPECPGCGEELGMRPGPLCPVCAPRTCHWCGMETEEERGDFATVEEHAMCPECASLESEGAA